MSKSSRFVWRSVVIVWDKLLVLIDDINWASIVQSILSTLLAAALTAIVFLLFWSKIRKRFLDDRYKIPLIDINSLDHKVRNIGQETALNVLIFHIRKEIPELTKKRGFTLRFKAAVPNLVPGESYAIDTTLESCFNEEFFLIQYANLSGIVYWCLQFAGDGRGNPWATIPPYRIRSSKKLPPYIGDEHRLRVPLFLQHQIRSIRKNRVARGNLVAKE